MDMTGTVLARTIAAACLAVLTAAAAACNNGSSSSSPTAPTTPAITETFSGTVPLSNADFFVFTVTQAGGEVDITFTAETPTTNPPVLVQLGTASADKSTCTPQSNTALPLQAVLNPVYPPFTTAAAGNFCVFIQDIFAQGPIGYTFTVAHH
jgi:hypothetical protein